MPFFGLTLMAEVSPTGLRSMASWRSAKPQMFGQHRPHGLGQRGTVAGLDGAQEPLDHPDRQFLAADIAQRGDDLGVEAVSVDPLRAGGAVRQGEPDPPGFGDGGELGVRFDLRGGADPGPVPQRDIEYGNDRGQ